MAIAFHALAAIGMGRQDHGKDILAVYEERIEICNSHPEQAAVRAVAEAGGTQTTRPPGGPEGRRTSPGISPDPSQTESDSLVRRAVQKRFDTGRWNNDIIQIRIATQHHR